MGSVADRKFAVVTGTSSGLGRELATQCAANGFDVLVCAQDAGIRRIAATVAVQADLSTRAATRAALAVAKTPEPGSGTPGTH
jgi:NAD(P)-dependent dehydrogenase (short-subunit alcohol dehydrogenase family)